MMSRPHGTTAGNSDQSNCTGPAPPVCAPTWSASGPSAAARSAPPRPAAARSAPARLTVGFVAIAALAVALILVGAAGVADARVLPRGMCQPANPTLYDDPPARTAFINDIRTNLRASWVRFEVFWSHGEPSPGTYDETYLGNVAATIAEARAAGLKVVVTVFKVPKWASQKDLWDAPAPGVAKGEYRDFYLPDKSSLDGFQAFMSHLAGLLGSDVAAYECWNEPNLWMFLAPQKRGGDTKYAARRYRDMLKHFRAGVKAAAPQALIVGGAFGPYGPNDRWRTSPQRFARQLKYLGAARYFDVLSHHPYQAGVSHRYAPDRLPRWPKRSVSLRNLNVLLKLFPGKPVYLTEYGYNTRDCPGIGRGVGAVRQADYLRKAYAYAARYSRVKMMIWYLQRDAGIWSTGLRTATGTKKPSWYTFSRYTKIGLKASRTRAPRGGRVKLTGVVRWTPRGGPTRTVAGKRLVLERKVGSGPWRRVRTLRCKSNGWFVTYVRPKRTTRYRVRWLGVTGSATRRVVVR